MSRFGRFVFGLALFGLAILGQPQPAGAQQIIGPVFNGNQVCVIDFSQGATFAAYGSGDMKSAVSTANAAGACTSGWYLSTCTVLNTHASQTVAVAFADISGAGPSATNRILIPAGASATFPILGLHALKIAVRGSNNATTGQIQCHTVPR